MPTWNRIQSRTGAASPLYPHKYFLEYRLTPLIRIVEPMHSTAYDARSGTDPLSLAFDPYAGGPGGCALLRIAAQDLRREIYELWSLRLTCASL
jgi:hypothetical protein